VNAVNARRLSLRVTAGAALLLAGAAVVHAYVLTGRYWPNGNIVMHLQLGAPGAALQDGSTTWGAPATAALTDWNALLVRSQFTTVPDSTIAKVQGDGKNSVFFSSSVYGDAWGSGVLAITLSYRNTFNFALESDVLFNTGVTWNSYRGALQRSGSVTTQDFRRVALHEFGHVLGLNHPDTATPAQFVGAIMNSTASDTYTLQDDDIAGARSLYGTAITVPTITTQPVSRTVATADPFTFSVGATGTAPLAYNWMYVAPGASTAELYNLAHAASYTIGSVQPGDAGTFYAYVSNLGGVVLSSGAALTVTPVAVSPNSRLANISTRGVSGTGAGIMITGFVIDGTTNKTVLVRGAGPAMAAYGVAGALVDPQLEVVSQRTGATVASNDNWDVGNDRATMRAAFTRLGAFDFANGSKDAAVLTSLPPGVYSAKLSGVGNATGVALVEAYDADPDNATALTRKLLNISTRGQVGTAENIMIAGLVVTGPAPRRFLIRAVGPTLTNYGVAGALDDPVLQIYDSTSTLIRENDDWDTPPSGQAAISDASNTVGAFPLQVRRDSAMVVTLRPGLYSAQVSGFGGATGVALVEVYELPN